MDHLWTIIFIVLIVTAFGLAHSHDCADARCRERRYEVHDEDENKEDETAQEKRREAS